LSLSIRIQAGRCDEKVPSQPLAFVANK